ncbi:MAG: hypothetical protein NT016_00655 [Candidatus Aenigmarchaeota archaeon]|nr:hypothetical protein [Candidatus Aenigmarchaeota archaeon]
MARSRRLRRVRVRVRSAVGEHKRAMLGVLLVMLFVSMTSLTLTQYIMSSIATLGFERIAIASLVIIGLLLIAVESRMRAKQAVAGVRSGVRRLRRRGRKSSRRRR